MTPALLRGMAASKLSFAQTLVRRMAEGRWRITLEQCDLAEDGTGFMAYEIQAEDLHLSFGVFVSPPLPPGHVRLESGFCGTITYDRDEDVSSRPQQIGRVEEGVKALGEPNIA